MTFKLGAGRLLRSSPPHDEFVALCAISTSGELTGEERTRLQEHLAVCPSCREAMKQYETVIHQISGSISVTGPNGSISVVLPASSNTYSVYIGTTSTTVTFLGVTAAGPLSGPFQGQATQLAGGQTVVITAIGVAQVPPSAPATGVTVYPSWLIGKYAFTQVVLDDIQVQLLDKADKADPYNQLREATWKVDYGTLLDNNLFAVRIESASQFSATFA